MLAFLGKNKDELVLAVGIKYKIALITQLRQLIHICIMHFRFAKLQF